MGAGNVYPQVSALLDESLEALGMKARRGPLRAAGELVRGILFTGSVQLSNAARLEADSVGRLAKAVNRLSHHLSDPTWDHREWAAAVLAQRVADLDDDDLIPIDATELAKPYARRMQFQGVIRDAAATLRQASGGRGIWLSDRGGDRPEVLSAWLRFQPRWIIRLRGDRKLIGPDGSLRPADVWADWALAQRAPRGQAVTLKVRLPHEVVRQSPDAPPLWLVVPTYTFADGDRWLLLTCGLIDQHTGPAQTRHDYAWRWRAEDAKRLLGQLWRMERFLTRSFVALQRMLHCTVVAGGFLARLQQEQPTLCHRLQQQVLYHDKPPVIPAYRLARGLQTLAALAGHAAVTVNA